MFTKTFSEKRLLIIIILIYFILRLIFFDTSYFFGDEAAYVLNSLSMTGTDYFNELSFRPPLVWSLLSPLILISTSEILIKLFPIFLNLFAVLAVYLLGRAINPKVGLLAALLLAVFPFHILSSRWVMTDAPNIIFFSLCLFFFYKALKTERQRAWVLTGVFFALAVLTKFTSLFLLIIMLPMFLYFRGAKLKNIAFGIISALIVLSPYLIISFLSFGNPIQPFIDASGVAVNPDPVDWVFVGWTVFDFLGPVLLVLLLFSFYLTYKNPTGYRKFLIYGFVLTLIFYLYLVQMGVCKPPYMEWEVERFLLPILLFALVLIADSLDNICNRFKENYNKILGFVIILFIILSVGLYQRAYTPSIEFENGLRNISKEASLYINENTPPDTLVYCNFDCPPKAYYTKRNLTIFEYYLEDAWETVPEEYYMIISDRLPPSQSEAEEHGLRFIKQFETEYDYIIIMKKE